MTSGYHTPALADEVVRFLDPQPGEVFVDGTVGGGGHAHLVGQRLQPGGTLIGIDRDPEALEAAGLRLGDLAISAVLMHGSFGNIRSLLGEHGIARVDGILLDLGVSSHQLDSAHRGFSFRRDGGLDLRMDQTTGQTAADLLARVDERELADILWRFGGERWSARIARFVAERRQRAPIRTTLELADLVAAAIPKGAHPPDTHPATRTFQALRIWLNREMDALAEGLEDGVALLSPGGRIAVVSYHSLEDAIVKKSFARLSGKCQCPPGLPVCRCGADVVVTVLTRKPVMPGEEEMRRNPRARSAKLRVAEKA